LTTLDTWLDDKYPTSQEEMENIEELKRQQKIESRKQTTKTIIITTSIIALIGLGYYVYKKYKK
jgi:uncharacterized membrane protein YebE (DUF533 family)